MATFQSIYAFFPEPLLKLAIVSCVYSFHNLTAPGPPCVCFEVRPLSWSWQCGSNDMLRYTLLCRGPFTKVAFIHYIGGLRQNELPPERKIHLHLQHTSTSWIVRGRPDRHRRHTETQTQSHQTQTQKQTLPLPQTQARALTSRKREEQRTGSETGTETET